MKIVGVTVLEIDCWDQNNAKLLFCHSCISELERKLSLRGTVRIVFVYVKAIREKRSSCDVKNGILI